MTRLELKEYIKRFQFGGGGIRLFGRSFGHDR
jgi:hypothetical protein